MAILGDYDNALAEFKLIFTQVDLYARRYEANAQQKGGMAGRPRQVANNSQDYYMVERWNQFKKDLKSEYDMIVQMHSTLMQLEDFPPGSVQSPSDEFYEVDGFKEPKQPQKPSSAVSQSAKRTNDAKKPRVPTASQYSGAKRANDKYSGGGGTPSVTKSVQPQMLKFKSQLPTPAAGGVS